MSMLLFRKRYLTISKNLICSESLKHHHKVLIERNFSNDGIRFEPMPEDVARKIFNNVLQNVTLRKPCKSNSAHLGALSVPRPAGEVAQRFTYVLCALLPICLCRRVYLYVNTRNVRWTCTSPARRIGKIWKCRARS